MENGVKILIERLKTNPEEFVGVNNRWMNMIETYKEYMSAEDRVALEDALRPVLMDKFNEQILYKLMRTEQEQMELDFDGKGSGMVMVNMGGKTITFAGNGSKP
ncbi:hypothetical protein [Flavobacterium sp.]|jgi:hypothetical protein|uniref:hypothetical protein n=1 Tax=Flavobacterium sp. TaxID=239 RepID=UPI0037BF7740